MDAMPPVPAHAKPARRDLLWVLILIAACGLLEVWASWLQIGSVSGFPKLGAMTTGWILPVTTEAYWTAALYAWLVDPAGPKSKKFAMGSGGAVFLLSLAGQESDHLLAAAGRTVPPVWVVGGVTALPLIAVALVAVLMHLRQADREAAARAQAKAAEGAAQLAAEAVADDERTALRADLDALAAEVEPLREALAAAQEETAKTLAKNEILTRRLAAAAPRKRTPQKPASKPAADPATAPRSDPAEDPATGVPNDVDAQAEALSILAAEPDISGAKLAERVGMSERWGQTLKKNLAGSATPKGPDAEDSP